MWAGYLESTKMTSDLTFPSPFYFLSSYKIYLNTQCPLLFQQCSKLKKCCQKNKTVLFLFKVISVCFLSWTSVSSENLKSWNAWINKVLMLLTSEGKFLRKLLKKTYVRPTRICCKVFWYSFLVLNTVLFSTYFLPTKKEAKK